MNPQPAPVLKDLVLLGGGHSHAIVLKLLGMNPLPGLRVTVVARDVHTPYSGMLPGLIAGHYAFDDAHIDLAPLAGFAGARLFHDEAVGLDLAGRAVLCRNRPPLPYDVLSINVGARPSPAVAGAQAHGVPVKPIGALVARWEQLQARVLAAPRPLQVAVVGAGAARHRADPGHAARAAPAAGRGRPRGRCAGVPPVQRDGPHPADAQPAGGREVHAGAARARRPGACRRAGPRGGARRGEDRGRRDLRRGRGDLGDRGRRARLAGRVGAGRGPPTASSRWRIRWSRRRTPACSPPATSRRS